MKFLNKSCMSSIYSSCCYHGAEGEVSMEIEKVQQVLRDAQSKNPPKHEQLDLEKIKHFLNKIGRNSPCPCGSGNKFKKCCLL